MNFIYRISMAVVFWCLMACFTGHQALALSWWESKQESTPTDRIQVTDSQFPGKVASASRANWEDGYIEVMAGATADTRDTVNLAHAFSVALKTARHLAYERHLGNVLNVRFLEQDVFSVLDAEQFDVVWTMEAISHIDPAEMFLVGVFKNLRASGHLVISDSHIWNPAMAWRVFKLRHQGVALRTTKTTSDGETVTYAQERLLSVGWLTRALKQAGFASVRTQLSIFFPPVFAQFPFMRPFCARFDTLMNQVPVIRNVGGIYTLVAGK